MEDTINQVPNASGNEESKQQPEDLQIVQRQDVIDPQTSGVGQEVAQTQNAAMFQSQLLTQMLQVGSLFSMRASLDDEEEQKQAQLKKLKEEREKNKKLKRRMKNLTANANELDLSSSDEEENMDPEAKLQLLFETNLKKRIFYADRVEKVEKALVQLNLISKDVLFCSDFEFNRFKEVASRQDVLEQISVIISADAEDVWFDLYRSITTDKEGAEEQIEKQIKRRQRREHKRLRIKSRRLCAIKESFIKMEEELRKVLVNKTSQEKKHIFGKVRRGSAPENLNYHREAIIQDRIVQKQQELLQVKRQQ